MRSGSLLAVAALAVVLAISLFSPVMAISGITVVKVTTNGDTTTQFDFTFSTGGNSESFDLVGGESILIGPIEQGVYTVKEVVPAGWFVSDISCEGIVSVPEPSSFEFIPGVGVIITYTGGDHVTCTFTNSPITPAVGGVLIPANVLSLISPWLAIIGLVGCVGAVVVAKKREK